ncbi:D-3-phosphoglycerate dehydrogenase [Desulfosarcina ovata subsp. sediminis]|uniref:D-3-phosphoglycerate dehydrogenase n=1 Tax=Desulfosarcina ovata subsp. sediminis TaxID=885957 RepID=A0A5K7ZCU7_9BACT|nr:phosphoglycerate dehydrogenase [Desulfosarcina ovata]BBO79998.1 D-3-phosphoglycerate dehydrogenase [Desulfosarcina ovata subsp. sediminis]
MLKVLVSDVLGDAGIQIFRDHAEIEVDVKTGLAPEELIAIIGEYDALVIRSATRVTEAVLEAGKKLKVVGRAGIGLDNVDIPAATKRGVVVMNTPTGNVVTTAEHAIAMMMALTRNIPQGTLSLKEGRWDKKKLQGREVFNKTLGVVGFGKIGSIVADRAKGLRMKVVIYDPFVTPEQIQKSGFESVSLDELYARADYISVHVPKLKETTGLLNKAAFDKMKDGVMLVNCARGGIVDEDDLQDAIQSGKVAGAALDVFETEPPGECRLLEMDRLICTPHLGASTREAQTNVAVAVAHQIIDYIVDGTVVNAVNVPSVAGDLLKKIGPYMEVGDRMGCLQAQLASGPVKAVIIEYTGDFKGMDMAPVSTAILKGLLTPMVKYAVNFVNAPIVAKEMGIKVTESTTSEAEDYTHLITLRVITDAGENLVAGTIIGRSDLKVVKINDFRLELVPEGHILLIFNQDQPGAIGGIGTTLGNHDINIGRMQVGQDKDGEHNIIFLQTDTPVPAEVIETLRTAQMVNSVTPLEL